MAGVGIVKLHFCPVSPGNLPNNGQTQASAVGICAQRSVKRLKHQVALGLTNARA
jgi:hypothetical protein